MRTQPGSKRQVVAIDSRGRGLSEYDNNPENYNVVVELADVVTVLTTLTIRPAIFIGSSRGGILTMLMGATRPEAIAGVVLHDIGPVIEPAGLSGQKLCRQVIAAAYVRGRRRNSSEFICRAISQGQPEEQWLAAAHRAWRNERRRTETHV